MGYCHYCQQQKNLIEAHILPRKFYIKNTNDPKANFQGIHKDGSYKIWQCGFFDKNILCADCDGKILALYDNEAYNLLLDIDSKKQIEEWNGIKVYRYQKGEFDYEKIRKFFISLIWRASISQETINNSINLGQYEDIALDLLKDNIQDDNLFKVIVCSEETPNDFTNVHYIMKTRYDRSIAYAVYFSKFVAYIIPGFKSSLSSNFREFNRLAINPNEFVIPIQSSLAEIKKEFLVKTFAKGIKQREFSSKIKKH